MAKTAFNIKKRLFFVIKIYELENNLRGALKALGEPR